MANHIASRLESGVMLQFISITAKQFSSDAESDVEYETAKVLSEFPKVNIYSDDSLAMNTLF